jgi:hypothetical protein
MAKSGSAAMVILKTHGMGIQGRARRLRSDLGKLEGIREIDFNYIMDSVSIRYDSNKLTIDEIRSAVAHYRLG